MEQNVPVPQRRASNCDFDCNISQNTDTDKEREKMWSDEERKIETRQNRNNKVEKK